MFRPRKRKGATYWCVYVLALNSGGTRNFLRRAHLSTPVCTRGIVGHRCGSQLRQPDSRGGPDHRCGERLHLGIYPALCPAQVGVGHGRGLCFVAWPHGPCRRPHFQPTTFWAKTCSNLGEQQTAHANTILRNNTSGRQKINHAAGSTCPLA